jgi:hypothetical protein
MAMLLASLISLPTTSAAASGALGTGVTKSSIRIGVTFVDVAAIRAQININNGNFPDAYNALTANINAHGGVLGRKLVPYYAPINPLGPAFAAAACSQLTENDKVFAGLGLFLPGASLCYTATHNTPIVGFYPLDTQDQQQAVAPWFLTVLNDSQLIPSELNAFSKDGVFKRQKVAVVAQVADASDFNATVPLLKKLGVDVVQTAINDVTATDTEALYQQYGLISQKFQAAGATEVVAVGVASDSWVTAQQANHSTYVPRLVALNYSDIQTYIAGKGGDDPALLHNAISASNTPPVAVSWNDPAIKKCVSIVHKAYPDDVIGNPVGAPASAPATWVAPQQACSLLTLFVDIAKAAGPNLNAQTFLRGGNSLKNVSVPGAGVLHYGPGEHDGNGPIYVYTWNASGTSGSHPSYKVIG